MPSISPEFKARELYHADDFTGCLEYIEKHRSELGAEGWFLTGEIYHGADKSTHGFGQNLRKAAAAYKKAAQLGHAAAACQLGKMYVTGSGVAEDTAAAIEWLGKAVASGNLEAAYELAEVYYDNDDLPESARAIELYEKASADEGLGASSLLKLGRIHVRGKCGAKTDVPRALSYLERAGVAGSTNGYMDLAYLYFKGNGVPRDLGKARAYAEKAGPKNLLYNEVMAELRAAEQRG